MESKLNYVVRSLSAGTHKKYETYVINAIYNHINNANIEFCTQQYVKTSTNNGGRRYIDLYFPQLKIAVEVKEAYHSSDSQIALDNERKRQIKDTIGNMILENEKDIDFQEIATYKNNPQYSEKTLEELNADILNVANFIKAKIESYPKPLSWELSDEERVKMVKSRGKLVRGDSFDLIKSVLSVYDIFIKKGASQKRAYTRLFNGKYYSLCISLTFGNGENHNSWTNEISNDLMYIYEGSQKGRKTKEDAERDIDGDVHRVVFGKYKDQFGNNRYRFLGMYVCDGYDDTRETEIWKLVSDSFDLKLLEHEKKMLTLK